MPLVDFDIRQAQAAGQVIDQCLRPVSTSFELLFEHLLLILAQTNVTLCLIFNLLPSFFEFRSSRLIEFQELRELYNGFFLLFINKPPFTIWYTIKLCQESRLELGDLGQLVGHPSIGVAAVVAGFFLWALWHCRCEHLGGECERLRVLSSMRARLPICCKLFLRGRIA